MTSPSSLPDSPANTDLALITALMKSLSERATLEEAERWRTQYLLIESELESHLSTTERERNNLRRLSEGVSTAIRSIRERWPNVSLSTARTALSVLQDSIEHRTIDVDGYPLRR